MRRSRKPLIGLGSIILAIVLAGIAYIATGDPLLAALLAGLPTFIAPGYFAWKMVPSKTLAAGVLASMISGGIAWLVIGGLGGTPEAKINPLIAFSSGLVTGGLGGHLSASAYFMDLLEGVSNGDPSYPIVAAGFLASCASTVLGLAIIRSIRRPRSLTSPSILVIVVLALSLLALITLAGG